MSIMEPGEPKDDVSNVDERNAPLPLIRLAGRHWRPELVSWAESKRGAYEMFGIPEGRPKSERLPPIEGVDPSIVNVWGIHAVYALYSRHELLYVGEGELGDRMLNHWFVDHLAGRWDSFTWLSPDEYVPPSGPGDRAAVRHRSETAELPGGSKGLVSLLEFVAIHLADPPENRKLHWREDQVRWLVQRASGNARPGVEKRLENLEKRIEEVLAHLKALGGRT